MSAIVIPSRWQRQPQGPVEIDQGHPLATGLIYAALMSGTDAPGLVRNYLAPTIATKTGTSVAASADSLAMQFNGSSDFAQHAIDLSPWAQITVSFWLWWDAFGTDNKCAISYHTETANNNGMFLNCNPVANQSQWDISASAGRYQAERFDAPTAGAWHHWGVAIDRALTTQQIRDIWIDGADVTNRTTASNTILSSTSWDNNSLLLGKAVNGGTSYWGAGKMRNVLIHRGQKTRAEIRELWANPWQIVRPLRRRFYSLTAGAGGSVAASRYYLAS